MEVKELKDSYPPIVSVVSDLQRERRTLVIPGKEGVPRYIYPDDPSFYVPMSQEFKSLWGSVTLPPDRETLLRELSKAGLKSMAVSKEETEATKNSSGKQGKRRRVNKRLKVTNVHLGLDLRRDLPS